MARTEALQVLALYAGVQVATTLGTGALLDHYEPQGRVRTLAALSLRAPALRAVAKRAMKLVGVGA